MATLPKRSLTLPASLRRRLASLFNRLRYRVDGPIIVYQMGKVGSMTVYDSLVAMNLGVPVYHSHLLNDLDAIEESVRKAYPNPGMTLKEIARGRQLRKEIAQARYHWNVISLTRDPVARNVSAFFENITELVPDFYAKSEAGVLDVDELIETFVERYQHNAPSDWFDSQLKGVFGIDVFSRPFPCDRGYDIFHHHGASLLVIRLENLDGCARSAMGQFLGIGNFRLARSNTAEDKRYRSVYQEFVGRIVLPARYLEEMYGSRFATHFYTPAELDGFRARWVRGGSR